MKGSVKLPMISTGLVNQMITDAISTDKVEIPAGDVDGVNTEFYLSEMPGLNSVRVFLNGIRQHLNSYAVDGDLVTFNAAPLAGDVVVVVYGIYPYSLRIKGETPTGDIDGVNTDFAFAVMPDPTTLEVYLNGVLQSPGIYAVAGLTLSFNEAPFSGDTIRLNYRSVGSGRSIYNEYPDEVPNGNLQQFTIKRLPAVGSDLVYLNGILQDRGTHYTIVGNVVTFTVAPYANDWIGFDYEL